MEELTHKYLLQRLDYDSKTGYLTWKFRPESDFKTTGSFKAWNTKYANKTAGSLDKIDGYIQIRIDYKLYRAHRLAWFYCYGYFPENEIDHKDRIRHHNWILNLREASRKCQSRNCSISKNNTSGVVGVSPNKQTKKLDAYIMVDRKKISLGCHHDLDQAAMARWKGEVKYKFPNCCTSSSAYNYLKDNNLLQ